MALPADAPFRQYAKTDQDVFQEGFERGATWPVEWNHLPGGPWVPDLGSAQLRDPDWRTYCLLLERHNKIWLEGWRKGVKTIRPRRRDIKKLLDIQVIKKLSG